MLQFLKGNLLESDSQALVNSVNCVGVMGGGIAAQFKDRYPKNYKAYAKACKLGEVVPGKMFVFEEDDGLYGKRYIINFPTKRHWRGKSKMEDIQSGLENLKKVIRENDIRSIAIPSLGAGLGGLEWREVRREIERALADMLDVKISIYIPIDNVELPKSVNLSKSGFKMTGSKAGLIILMSNYLSAQMEFSITLLEVHKLMYFLQETGVPLKLRYVENRYGPYAENLRHFLRDIDGYYISQGRSWKESPYAEVQIVPGGLKDARNFIESKVSYQDRIKRVEDLIDGFETPLSMELLSSVHWVAKREGTKNLDKIVEAVHNWNDRKRKIFPKEKIEIAYKALDDGGWFAKFAD